MAFRKGATCFWRDHCPELLSEGATANKTTHSTIFGLTGLSIEAREESGWSTELSQAEARLATRYALHELNGFPTWLPGLYRVHPKAVIDVVITEIDYELANDTSDSGSHYVLYDASQGGDWMFDQLGPLVIAQLNKAPKSIGNLRLCLVIIGPPVLLDQME